VKNAALLVLASIAACTEEDRAYLEQHGGNGIAEPQWREDHWYVEWDIILGRNTRGY
jgi:hypothetical protein